MSDIGVRNFVGMFISRGKYDSKADSSTALKHMQLMKKGDLAFFYHSNCKTPGVAGIMEIVREHSIDGAYGCLDMLLQSTSANIVTPRICL